jgi:translation initiation factor IF-3
LKPHKEDLPLINEKIRFEKVHLILQNGENVGVVPRDEALRAAHAAHLDLVLIAERGGEGFPVVKIMDFGKVIYAKKKQQAEAKKHQKTIQIKEIKIRPKISEHDYQTKLNQGVQFLKDGKRLKITLMFRGREAATKEERGSYLFDKINQTFEKAGIAKNVVQEKDMQTPQFWSRIYFLKK